LFFSARRLERIIKEVLEDMADDKSQLSKVLTGRRVLLAEELSEFTTIPLVFFTDERNNAPPV
jgi:hypothetical protein